MIVSSNTDANKSALFSFLREQEVEIQATPDFQSIGRVNAAGELIAAVGYNGFCGRVCSMHIAGVGNWLSRDLLRAAFNYAFVTCDLVAVLSPIASDNARALKFDKHIGFKEVHRVPGGWSHAVDLVILQLNRQDCRWLKKETEHEDARQAA